MKNSLVLILISVTLLGFSGRLVSAETTSYIYPTNYVNVYNPPEFQYANAILAIDNTTANSLGALARIETAWNFGSQNIPNNAINLRMQFKYVGGSITSGSSRIRVDYKKNTNGAFSWCTAPVSGHSNFTNNSVSFSGTTLATYEGLESENPLMTVTDLQNGTNCIGLEDQGGVGYVRPKLDAAQARVVYDLPEPSVTVSNVVASQSAQTVTLDLSGDTTYIGGENTCVVNVSYNSLNNSQNVPQGVLATILLDTSYTGLTQLLSNNQYRGTGYAVNDSTWQAVGITLPFLASSSVDIRTSTICVDGNGNVVIERQNLDSRAPNFTPSGIATPSALQNNTAVAQPNCSNLDLVCSFQVWLSNTFNYIFGINQTVATQRFYSIKNKMNNKAPFAYINSALAVDLSNVSTTSAVPTLSIPITHTTGVSASLPTSMEWDDSTQQNVVKNFSGSVLITFNILLWLAFLFYCFTRVRHIL